MESVRAETATKLGSNSWFCPHTENGHDGRCLVLHNDHNRVVSWTSGDHCIAIPGKAFQLGHSSCSSNFEKQMIPIPGRHIVAVSSDIEKILVDGDREK